MYPFRKELVGKRFMCVRGTTNSRQNSRSNRSSNPLDYTWKCGIIRACAQEDCNNPEQKILVEYDNEDWSTREWINIYKESWKIFLVEKTMVWAQRHDPNNPKRPILWPALTFYPLVDKHGLEESQSIGVEFLGDHFRAFCTSNEMRPYQEDDGLQPALRNNAKVVEELVNWQTLQKSQGILIHGPFTLTGFRVQVYREKCRQWFSAVITSHDLISREMDVMDDTVLQTHRINPRLVMVLLLANEVELDSMLRGDLVRVLPVRRNRQSQVVITSPLTPETNSSGNSMWQFLNDMWRDPNSSHQGSIYTSSSLNETQLTTTTSTACSSATQRRRKSDSSRENRRKANSSPEQRKSPDHQPSDTRLQSSHSSSPEHKPPLHKSHTTSPVQPSYGHSSRSPISSPVRYPSHYSSMENLSHTSPSPRQHISPQRPSSTSILNASPQRPFTSPQKTSPLLSGVRSSPVDNHCRSPPKIMDHKHGFLGSPTHSMSPSRQYTPPKSSSSFSPFRSTKLSPGFGSPVLGGPGVSQSVLPGSRISPSQPCMSSLGHCRDAAAHLVGACGCSNKVSPNQNMLESQLYALQVHYHQQRQQHQQQQQLKQHQSLSQCQMYINQLQLMAEQLKAVQKGTLTHEQTEILTMYYNQIIQRYEEESMLDYHAHPPAQDMALLASNELQMQMHLKYLEEQEKQKYLRQPYLPTFEPEHLQAFFSHFPQGANAEHLHKLCANLTQKQSPELTKKQEKDTSVKDHVARLKRFIPNCQQQTKDEQTSSSSHPSSSRNTFKPEPSKTSTPVTPSPLKTATPSQSLSSYTPAVPVAPLVPSEKEENKTDDQKVVAAMNKPSLSENQDLSLKDSDPSLNTTLKPTTSESSKDQPKNTPGKHRRNSKEMKPSKVKNTENTSNNDDPFGFDVIHDDDPFGFNVVKDVNSDAKTNSSLPDKDNGLQAMLLRTNFDKRHDTELEQPSTTLQKDANITKETLLSQEHIQNKQIDNSSLHKPSTEKQETCSSSVLSSVDSGKEKQPTHETTALSSPVEKISKEDEGLISGKKPKSKQRLKKDKKITSTTQENISSKAPEISGDNKIADKEVVTKLSKSQSKQSKKEKKTTPSESSTNSSVSQEESCVTNSSEYSKEQALNRASVIMYVNNKPSSKVSSTNSDENQPREQTVVSPIESEMLSVNKLLEFHKTSAQEAVKVFEDPNMFLDAQSIPAATKTDSNTTGKESDDKKKQTKKRKNSLKDTSLSEEETSLKKTSKKARQNTPIANLFPEPCQESLSNNRTNVNLGHDLVNRFLGQGQNSKFFPDIGIETQNEDLTCQNKGRKSLKDEAVEQKELVSETNSKGSHTLKEHQLPDWRMSRENRNARLTSLSESKTRDSESSSFPVNFVADQTVRNMTVNHAMEPVAVSSLFAKEYTVKQIKMLDSEEETGSTPTEQRRKRKKSRKVLENESVEGEKATEKSKKEKEPKKNKKAKADDKGGIEEDTKEEEIVGKVKADKATKKVKKDSKGKNKEKDSTETSNQEGSVDELSEQPSQGAVVTAEQSMEIKKKKKEEKDSKEKKKKSTKPKNKDEPTEKKKKKKVKDGEIPSKETMKTKHKDPVKSVEHNAAIDVLSLECAEKISDNVIDHERTDSSSKGHSIVDGESGEVLSGETLSQETDKDAVEEKPIKEIIDKLAAKKKTEKTYKRKKKNQDSEDSATEVKKRKVRQPLEEFFVQNGGCSMFPNLPKCRDCRDEEEEGSSLPSQNCCRFTLFRRLKKKKRSGKIHVAGFLVPENAEKEDLDPWVAHDDVINVLSKDSALYILKYIADEFCSLVQEEKEAKTSRGEGAIISYKRAVIGLREMCDACATTIFNIHWVCQRCGFGVCLDCYDLRVKEKTNPTQCGKKVFEFKWVHCMPGLCHQPKNLTIAQIIPKEVLNDLSHQLHQIRTLWNIGDKCPCQCRRDTPKLTEISENDPKIEACIADDTKKTDAEQTAKIENIEPNSALENKDVDIKTENVDSKPVVKKTLMEKVRERIKERIEAQKVDSLGSDISVERPELLKVENQCDVKIKSEFKKEDTNKEYTRLEPGSNTVKSEGFGNRSCSADKPVLMENNLGGSSSRTLMDNFKLKEDKKIVKNDVTANNDQKPVNLSSGLSLLLNYDSSSEDSPDISPRKCPPADTGPASNAFDFNLGLLALVASKSTEITNTETSKDIQKDSKNVGDSNNDATGSKDSNVLTKKEANEEKLLNWYKTAEQMAVRTDNHPVSVEVATPAESTPCITMETSSVRDQPHSDEPVSSDEYPAPHSFMCNGRLLRLHEPHHPGNSEAFAKRWLEGKPILISNIDKLLDSDLWSPESFEKEFGDEIADVVNCRTGKTVENFSVGAFWKGFESVKDRAVDSSGDPMLLKLKDWPPGADFSEKLPSRFKNLMDHIPLPDYTRRDGLRNLVSRLPNFFVKPDLGPKMYNAYGSAAFPNEGTTNLHIDMSDAVNIMVYVGVPRDEGAGERERTAAIKAVDVACDEIQQQRVRRETARIGALWHIFEVDDADKIREFLLEVAKERKMKYPTHHDPIHDQCFYLDEELRGRLKKDHNVEGYAICQCLGDGVFIPAGAPHQVRNLYSCVKIAEDFVSPERIGQCFKTTQEFRHLSDKHTNHEDKLQIKNIIYHAVKDAVHVLQHHDKEHSNSQQHNS